MDKVREQKTFIRWDETKAEAKKITLSAWIQWYHKPYESDWREAYVKAQDRRWMLLEG